MNLDAAMMPGLLVVEQVVKATWKQAALLKPSASGSSRRWIKRRIDDE